MSRSKKTYHKRRNAFARTTGARGKPKQTFLIVCEGEKTEPNYFKSFRVSSAAIEIVGSGFNTVSLVEETKRIVKKRKKYDQEYDQVWCVFDRDDYSSTFNAAIEKARSYGFKVAYSNEAFELWYLLHFMFFSSAIARCDYSLKLNEHIKGRYEKNSKTMYYELLPHQGEAIRNAQRLLDSYVTNNPNKENPSTTVHLLVEELNKYL